MGFLDGELAQIVGDALVDAGMSKALTLTRVTATARIPGSVTQGTDPTMVTHAAQGFVAQLESYLVKDTLIKNVTRVIKIYGSTINPVTVPQPGDRIAIEGVTSVIVDNDGGKLAVQRDPASAVYTCQCR